MSQDASEICARIDLMAEAILAKTETAAKVVSFRSKTERLDNAVKGRFRRLEKSIGPLTEQMIEEERLGQLAQAGGGLLFAVLFGVAIAVFRRVSNICKCQGDKEFCVIFSSVIGSIGIAISLIVFIVQFSDAMTPVLSLMSHVR